MLKQIKKGQDKNHLALLSSSFMDKNPSNAVYENVSQLRNVVKCEKAEMQLASFSKLHFIQAPHAGLEPATATALKRSSIQLSYRGVLSFDNLLKL